MSAPPAGPAPRMRARPEDFVVEEIPLYAPCGEGGHTFVHVEKRLRTTEQVAADLARAAGVRPREVGYAGRKDRVAVTRQWFSVPELDPEAARGLELPGARVIEAERHRHKLRTGQLRANRFAITLRGVSPEQAAAASERLETVRERGFANRFGAQRFGAAGDTAELGRAVLQGETRVADRRRARFAVSALQALVFNEVLARRPLPLDVVEPGDLAVVHESGGIFEVEDADRECERARRFEISPTGPLFGTRARRPGGAPAGREEAVQRELGIPPADALRAPRGIRLRGARRALRARPDDATLACHDGVLELRFTLPAGVYATVLIEALVGAVDSTPASDAAG